MAVIGVVKYDGGPDLFAWKYPCEELGTWTQLIINESQEVVLMRDGQALDLFLAGRHTLQTANIPILNKIVKLPFGVRFPFTAEVWYINKINSLDIEWETASPLQIQDPKYKITIPLWSFGEFNIQIVDSKKFLNKLVGALPAFDKDSISKYFRELFLGEVTDSIASYLTKWKIDVLEINLYLDGLSKHLQEKFTFILNRYGLNLINFCITDIILPEDDPRIITLKDIYKNGLNMDVPMEDPSGNPVEVMSQPINMNEIQKCPKCNTKIELGKRFCYICGFDTHKNNEQENKTSNETTCHKCGTVIAKKSKFCPECGESLNKDWASNEATLDRPSKYCHECGHKR